jgi:hypothetical protein
LVQGTDGEPGLAGDAIGRERGFAFFVENVSGGFENGLDGVLCACLHRPLSHGGRGILGRGRLGGGHIEKPEREASCGKMPEK